MSRRWQSCPEALGMSEDKVMEIMQIARASFLETPIGEEDDSIWAR